MRTRSAAPLAGDQGAAQTSTGNGANDAAGHAASQARGTLTLRGVAGTSLPDVLSPTLRERLGRHGIRSCEDWAALSRKRRRALWGITGAMVDLVDKAVRDALAVPA